MTVIRDTGQLPIMVVDKPLFALAKHVQWQWPNSFGESSFIVILGGLHTEIALWRMVGHLLEDSGWTNVLSEAEIAPTGTAESFLHASHVTRTRHAHQVTSLAVAKLQHEAFEIQQGETGEKSFSSWKADVLKKVPMFKFWNLILELELLLLIFCTIPS